MLSILKLVVLPLWGVAALATAAAAQTARLPLAEGVWVPLAKPCATATNVFVHAANRFGSVYFYGPGQTMGPANETELISHLGRGRGGFTLINDGPLEVSSRPGGQAIVRANSPVQGATWSETVRLCPRSAQSAKLRSALARLGLSSGP